MTSNITTSYRTLPDAPTTHIRLQQLPRCIHGVSPACQRCREGHEQMMREIRQIASEPSKEILK